MGEVTDIDMVGPDNGSVMLVERAPDHFINETVRTEKYGWHPEFGAREWGFYRHDGIVTVYTRAVSRPGYWAAQGGSHIQLFGWTRMMEGISSQISLEQRRVIRVTTCYIPHHPGCIVNYGPGRVLSR